MSRSKQTSKGRGRSRAVTAFGVAGALSLAAGGASASLGPARDIPTENSAPVILAEEEISDVSLSTFYVFDKENAGAHRPGVQLAARGDVAAGAVQCAEAAAAAPCTEAAAAAPWEAAGRLRWRMRWRLLYLDCRCPHLLDRGGWTLAPSPSSSRCNYRPPR